MNRRAFLSGLPVAVASLSSLSPKAEDAYVPVGYLSINMAAAINVARVTLNGKEIEGVCELNDIEGWLTRHVFVTEHASRPAYATLTDATAFGDTHRHHTKRCVRQERLSGVVRVEWKA